MKFIYLVFIVLLTTHCNAQDTTKVTDCVPVEKLIITVHDTIPDFKFTREKIDSVNKFWKTQIDTMLFYIQEGIDAWRKENDYN